MENYSSLIVPNLSLNGVSTIPHHDCQMNNSSLQVPLAIFYSLFFLFGLVGNLLALWVFLRLHFKKNSIRIFLINLALADLLLVICLPFRVMYHFNNDVWVLPAVLCRIVGTFFYINIYMSITLLGLISVDRYLKFQRASCRRMFLKTRWSILLCCINWALAFAAMMSLVVQKSEDADSQKCFQYKTLHSFKWKAYFNLVIVALFWVVFGGLVISYGRIGMKLLKTSREKPDFPNAAKYNKTALKTFFVLFLFTVCFVPYHFVRIFYIMSQMEPDTSCEWKNMMDKTNEIVLLLSTLNGCLDPVMYFLLCGSIRKAVLNVVCNCCCLQNVKGFFTSSDAAQEQIKPNTVL